MEIAITISRPATQSAALLSASGPICLPRSRKATAANEMHQAALMDWLRRASRVSSTIKTPLWRSMRISTCIYSRPIARTDADENSVQKSLISFNSVRSPYRNGRPCRASIAPHCTRGVLHLSACSGACCHAAHYGSHKCSVRA